NEIQRNAEKYMPPAYTLTDLLVRLGFKKKQVDDVFSSTKIWIQLMKQYKDILQDHSLEFIDHRPSRSKDDNNATVITTSDVRLFNLSLEDPKDLPFLAEVVGFQANNVKAARSQIANGFRSIYERG